MIYLLLLQKVFEKLQLNTLKLSSEPQRLSSDLIMTNLEFRRTQSNWTLVNGRQLYLKTGVWQHSVASLQQLYH